VTGLYDNKFSCPTALNILVYNGLFTASKPTVKDENVAKIWTLSAQDIDDDEIVRTMDHSRSTVMYITLCPVFGATHHILFWC